MLDMEPYTAEGLARREQAESEVVEDVGSVPDVGGGGDGLIVNTGCMATLPTTHIHYELVGVVVHSGQANAGHYYSFIKDRR